MVRVCSLCYSFIQNLIKKYNHFIGGACNLLFYATEAVEWRISMKKMFISDSEHKKCKRVANAFTELYKKEDTIVLDAGKYGFVKLQYYHIKNGFDCVTTYTDSKKLFNSLWDDWLFIHIFHLAESEACENTKCICDIIKNLPHKKQKELANKKRYFLKKSGL